ncbi:MAG: hypothetical protein H6735_00565 [Alphaproteobacteria bacterium]|nr:hypothetical protein [Alphaproteobacteria bacterium]
MRSENLDPASTPHPAPEELLPMEPTTETDHEATMEAPLPSDSPHTPVPPWSFPVVAAVAAGGGWAAGSLHPLATASVGWLLGVALAATLRRWSGGLLLTASGWVIGGIGVGSVLTLDASRGAAAYADAGLVGVGLVALAAPGEPEQGGSWWIWPSRALLLAGVVQTLARAL